MGPLAAKEAPCHSPLGRKWISRLFVKYTVKVSSTIKWIDFLNNGLTLMVEYTQCFTNSNLYISPKRALNVTAAAENSQLLALCWSTERYHVGKKDNVISKEEIPKDKLHFYGDLSLFPLQRCPWLLCFTLLWDFIGGFCPGF